MILMGHRGARNEKPENTMAGFQHIADLGLKCVELDIHLSKDGHLMVIHDEALERTTNGQGAVNSHTLDELQALDAGDGEKIPSLSEVLDLLLPLDFEIQIEIKDPQAVAPLLTYLNGLCDDQLKSLIIISFDHRTIFKVKNQIPSIRTTAILHGYPLDPCSIVKAARADGLSVNIAFADQDLFEKLKEEDYLVTVWNANTEEQYKAIKDLNIDYLATDAPTDLLKWMNN